MMLGSVQQLLWSNPPSPQEKTHKVTRCWSTPAPVPKADFDERFGLHLVPGGHAVVMEDPARFAPAFERAVVSVIDRVDA